MHTNDLLLRYCDLRIKDLEALRDPASAHPATLAQLRQDGLLTGNGVLTITGAEAVRNAEQRERSGPPAGNGAAVRIPTWAALRRLNPPLTTCHAKLLRLLYQHPGHAYRWLCRMFGEVVVEDLKRAGLATGWSERGAQWYLTLAGSDLVRDWVVTP
ncbi:MAG: hypothetical protein H8D78_16420 [Chloroflexi bacterium]|nr:hypothetical protein [Chloroflexota bacterium]